MKLWTKVAIMVLCMLAVVTALAGVFLPAILYQDTLSSITDNSEKELELIDHSVSNLISCTKSGVLELSQNPAVRRRNDEKFTDYLSTEEDSSGHNITVDEKKINDVLYAYRQTHPHINLVYMGRENGAYLKTDERFLLKYDPRDRPWYTLAKENPDQVMVTEPYHSLVIDNMNIGVVKALTDENGTVYGVVGADLTFQSISDFVSGMYPIYNGNLIITDKEGGIIISGEDSSNIDNKIGVLLEDNIYEYIYSDDGAINLDEGYLIYHTSPVTGWKIGLFIPDQEIAKETNEAIISVIIYVIAGLILLSALMLFFLTRNIIGPISDLTEVSRKITETGDLNQDIDVKGTAEIKTLILSFREMVKKLQLEEYNLNQALENEKNAKSELKRAHDELEEKVLERTAELAEANRHLKELDKTKSIFIASMNHELRTPLNLIIGFTDLILNKNSGSINETQEKQLRIVLNSSKHLLNLINQAVTKPKIQFLLSLHHKPKFKNLKPIFITIANCAMTCTT